MNAETDKFIIEKDRWHLLRSGHQQTWQQFLGRALSLIFDMYMKRRQNRSLAEELTQKTVYDAVRNRQSYDPEKGSPEQWIFTIARNNLAEHCRRQSLRKTITLDVTLAATLGDLDGEPLPDEVLEKQETANVVKRSLSQLPANMRTVLELKYMEDMPAREIAKRMKLTEKAVHSLLYRARLELRDKIKQIAPLIEEEQKK